MFSNNEFNETDLFSNTSAAIPDGEYKGKITKAEVTKSTTGNTAVKLEITLENGLKFFDRLNLQHPTAGVYAKKALARIVKGAYKNPEGIKLNTIEEVARFLKSVPVNATIKQNGTNEKGYMQYKVFYNPLSEKLTFAQSNY